MRLTERLHADPRALYRAERERMAVKRQAAMAEAKVEYARLMEIAVTHGSKGRKRSKGIDCGRLDWQQSLTSRDCKPCRWCKKDFYRAYKESYANFSKRESCGGKTCISDARRAGMQQFHARRTSSAAPSSVESRATKTARIA